MPCLTAGKVGGQASSVLSGPGGSPDMIMWLVLQQLSTTSLGSKLPHHIHYWM